MHSYRLDSPAILSSLKFLSHYNQTTCCPDRSCLITSVPIPGLAKREGNVAVFNHMLDLSPHYYTVSRCIKRTAWLDSLVNEKRISQYTTNTGQKTGKLKISNQLHTKLMTTALVAECQNLNSGSRLMKGRNSSSCLVGSELRSPSSIPSSCVRLGSNFGCRKARKRLRR